MYLLATELLPWDPIEWAHLSWGPHALPFHCPAHCQIPAQNQGLLVGGVEALQSVCLSGRLIESLLPLKSERPFQISHMFMQNPPAKT